MENSKSDLDLIIEYCNRSSNRARDNLFNENTNNSTHMTVIITCDQIAKFVKFLKENKKDNWDNDVERTFIKNFDGIYTNNKDN
tara:strand:+ start:353 stop:604 length:252 start_codon:yes stop_codon:yes gene_type:complete